MLRLETNKQTNEKEQNKNNKTKINKIKTNEQTSVEDKLMHIQVPTIRVFT